MILGILSAMGKVPGVGVGEAAAHLGCVPNGLPGLPGRSHGQFSVKMVGPVPACQRAGQASQHPAASIGVCRRPAREMGSDG
jgi:hypothetical protein